MWVSLCTYTLTQTLTTPVKETPPNPMSSAATEEKWKDSFLQRRTHTRKPRFPYRWDDSRVPSTWKSNSSGKRPEGKSILTWNLFLCHRLTKQKLTYSQRNSGEESEMNKLAILFMEGCLRACMDAITAIRWYRSEKWSCKLCNREVSRLGHVSLL